MTDELGPLIGAGLVAEAFAWGEGMVKLYRPGTAHHAVFREAAAQALAESLGLPVPAVWGVRRIGDRWGLLMQRIAAPTLADQLRQGGPAAAACLQQMAALQARLHRCQAIQLPSLRARLSARIATAPIADPALKTRLAEGVQQMPDGDRLCHGDFHPLNLLGDTGHATIIDWADACRGEPAADLCRSYLTLRLHAAELAEPYLQAYCAVTSTTPDKCMTWLPYVAAARLHDKVPGEAEKLPAFLHPAAA